MQPFVERDFDGAGVGVQLDPAARPSAEAAPFAGQRDLAEQRRFDRQHI